jgi:hypothetical protein
VLQPLTPVAVSSAIKMIKWPNNKLAYPFTGAP